MSRATTAKRHAPLCCRKDDPERGRYLVAAKAIPKGRLLFCERPLVALQSLGNPVWACHACKAFVGGPKAALEILATRSLPTSTSSTEYKTIPCRYQCGQVYCSPECESDFWEDRHQYLCTGRIAYSQEEDGKEEAPQQHPLIQFKQHAVTTNEIFLLVAEWMMGEHSFRQNIGSNEAADENTTIQPDDRFLASNPFQDFMMEPWWELDEGDAEEEKEVLKKLCREAENFWNKHWKGLANNNDERGCDRDTMLYMANIIGACELNSIGVRRRNPTCRDIAKKELRQEMKKELLSCLQHAGMLAGANEEDDEEDDQVTSNAAPDNKPPNDGNTPGQVEDDVINDGDDDDVSYTDDDLAGFLAGLDMHEEETTEKSNNLAIEDSMSIDAEKGDVEDNDNNSDDGGADRSHYHSDGDHDDLDALFSPMDGTAMFALCCKMNHSCEPNVVVTYKTRGWGGNHPLVAYCTALKDIEPGEELCISYISSDDPWQKRQAALKHYGFSCNCSKCQRERNSGTSGNNSQENNNANGQSTSLEEELLFGSDSDDSDSDIEEKTGNPTGIFQEDKEEKEAADGEAALEQAFGLLDTVLNHATLGAIPIPYLAQASSFVIQTATAAMRDLHGTDGTISSLLEKCIHSLRERDFVLAKAVGEDLEGVLIFTLKKESKWPSPAYREAFWSAAITAAVGLTHQCSFLSAIAYLDKAIILGLDRHAVDDFFGYVELHASQMSLGPYPPAIVPASIPDYNLPEYDQVFRDKGLSSQIQHRTQEILHLDVHEIQSSYISKSKPVVVRQYAIDWPAIQKWRFLTFFCRYFGHRLVPIELGSMKSESGMKEELMTLRQFFSGYLAESTTRAYWTLEDARTKQNRVAYLAQHPLIHQLPELGGDIEMQPSLCGELGPSHVYLWIGTGGTRTPLHFDSYSNIFVQLVGVKYVRIYSARETPKLYVSKNESYGLQGNMSDVDCEQEDFCVHPLAKDAAYEELLLFPGDALFIPARAWHYIRSLTTSVSVNFWF